MKPANTEDDDRIPTIGEYRGVGLDDHQSPKRLRVVRREINAVLDTITDTKLLLEVAGDPGWSPEARRLCAAKLYAEHQIAVEERRVRPPFDLAKVEARVAMVRSQNWRDPTHYCSLLCDYTRAVKREVPLVER